MYALVAGKKAKNFKSANINKQMQDIIDLDMAYMSKYGREKSSEYFAECFANYMLDVTHGRRDNVWGVAMEMLLKDEGIIK